MTLAKLPLQYDFNQIEILKKCSGAHRALAELKGICQSIPNSAILINTLTLTEAKDSSQIENIITTYNDLCKETINIDVNAASKEVKRYVEALQYGFFQVKNNNLLINRYIIQINNILQNNSAGFRSQMGTVIKNGTTGEIVHEPPQHLDEINELMANLERYINEDVDDLDPLIKMAIMHYQFESIHPFFDGNGRTGRILNVLYLVLKNLLDIPVLYLSRYIIQNKDKYYKLLQSTRDNNDWKSWIIYMLDGVEQIANQTITQVINIRNIHKEVKDLIRNKLPKIYSRELLDGLFVHTYTKIEYLQKQLCITRQTASNRLAQLVEIGVLDKVVLGKSYYFINKRLVNLLHD